MTYHLDVARDNLDSIAERLAHLEALMAPLRRPGSDAMTPLESLARDVGFLAGRLSRLAERLDALERLMERRR